MPCVCVPLFLTFWESNADASLCVRVCAEFGAGLGGSQEAGD